MEKNIKSVPAHNIRQSSILPPRQHNEELTKSVKQVGIQQPIIVRPIPGKNDEYEIVDGQGRRESVGDDEQVLIDVRHDLKDSEVFRISESTFQRKERTAYETAQFYAAWLKTLEKEEDAIEGLQQKLATKVNLSESSLSQYIAIARLFEKLQELAPKEPFIKLKTWSINKLYKLSELPDDTKLIDIARLFELKSEVSIEEVEDTVNSYTGVEQILETIFDRQDSNPETEVASAPLEQPSATSPAEPKATCLKNARRVASLAAETHDMLNALANELVQDADRFSSDEILQTLTKVLHTLRKLKRHSNVLKQKMNLN